MGDGEPQGGRPSQASGIDDRRLSAIADDGVVELRLVGGDNGLAQ
jgi:hypothetical protein